MLQRLELQNFRNYKTLVIDLEEASSVFLIGKNGQGKTNFLESLYYLSYGNSFRSHKEEQVLLHGQNYYKIKGVFTKLKIEHTLEIFYRKNKKTIRLNGTIIKNRKDILNVFPCLIFKHSDIFFISGGPEYQRQYLDQNLVLNHSEYTLAFQQYKRILLYKNIALKNEEYKIISIYNEQLASFGVVLINYRKKLIEFINQHITTMFSEVFGVPIKIQLLYFPSWPIKNIDTKNMIQRTTDFLNSRFEQEKKNKTSVSGPHRDIIKIQLDKHDFKSVASTGQIRIVSLLFRVLQAKYYYQQTKKSMVYLFDDVLLELDIEKQKNFLQKLPPTTQSFFTFLPEESLSNIIQTETKKFFNVQKGILESIE